MCIQICDFGGYNGKDNYQGNPTGHHGDTVATRRLSHSDDMHTAKVPVDNTCSALASYMTSASVKLSVDADSNLTYSCEPPPLDYPSKGRHCIEVSAKGHGRQTVSYPRPQTVIPAGVSAHSNWSVSAHSTIRRPLQLQACVEGDQHRTT